jgi:DNA invertase Pin-like site-specific DNA recombinase
MTSAALYARYSSDHQSSASIADQLRVCREQAAREGWTVTACYHDAALSGASMILRPGIQALLADARSGSFSFDVVLAEALDRISRERHAVTEAARAELIKVSRAIQEIVAQVETGAGAVPWWPVYAIWRRVRMI